MSILTHATSGEDVVVTDIAPNVIPEQQIRAKMEKRGIPEPIIENFLVKVRQIREKKPYVSLREVNAVPARLITMPGPNVAQASKLGAREQSLMERLVVIKLNGGRSTTMGGRVPKGILEAKNGRSYLDIILGQVAAMRYQWRIRVPLVLMNSFFTHGPTMEIVKKAEVPVLTFLQNQVPRLTQETLEPLETDTEEDWAPPGHGDVYETLRQSGLLAELRSEGYRWAFISNLDNLAACPEPWILDIIERERIDFLMEVTRRTDADRKGGCLVMRDGRIHLLEIAQVAPEERRDFMNIRHFPVFNTNNVWVDLEELDAVLSRGELNLPLIQNRKRINGLEIVQIETAMGAAIACFPRARALLVERDRFCPTKKVSDLFALRSDACILDSMDRLRLNPRRLPDLPFMPRVVFGEDFLDSPDSIPERFEDPASVSLVRARSLEVQGSVFFERDIIIEGNVIVQAPDDQVFRVPRGSILRDATYP